MSVPPKHPKFRRRFSILLLISNYLPALLFIGRYRYVRGNLQNMFAHALYRTIVSYHFLQTKSIEKCTPEKLI